MENKLKQHLDAAYTWLSKTPRDFGELVDFQAMARQELREAAALAAAIKLEVGQND